MDGGDDILIDVQPLFDNTWQDVPFVQAMNPGRNGARDPFPYQSDNEQRPFDPGGDNWAPYDPPLNETLGVWRQARIALRDFAGSGDLKLRFEYGGEVLAPPAVNVNKDIEFCGKHGLKSEKLLINPDN